MTAQHSFTARLDPPAGGNGFAMGTYDVHRANTARLLRTARREYELDGRDDLAAELTTLLAACEAGEPLEPIVDAFDAVIASTVGTAIVRACTQRSAS